jgi:molecular chaperone DnaK (HSP70)
MVQAWGVTDANNNTVLHSKVLCRDGEILLGGKNWDEEFKDLYSKLDLDANAHDLKSDPLAGDLDDICEQNKRTLSQLSSVKLVCNKMHQIEVSREMLAEKTYHLVQQTRQIMESVIDKAVTQHGIDRDKITVLLSGGMCKWPPVTDMLKEMMGNRAPILHKNVNFMVTYGASYLAYLSVVSEPSISEPKPGPTDTGGNGQTSTDSTPTKPEPQNTLQTAGRGTLTIARTEVTYPAIGVKVLKDPTTGEMCIHKVIPSGKLGSYFPGKYETTEDDQTLVNIFLYYLIDGHDESETALKAWHEYKSFDLTIPAKKKGQVKISVDLKYTADGTIEGRAFDDAGHVVPIKGEPVQPTASST